MIRCECGREIVAKPKSWGSGWAHMNLLPGQTPHTPLPYDPTVVPKVDRSQDMSGYTAEQLRLVLHSEESA